MSGLREAMCDGREVGQRAFKAARTSGVGRQVLSARVETVLKRGAGENVWVGSRLNPGARDRSDVRDKEEERDTRR
jgi:hypothetical protein